MPRGASPKREKEYEELKGKFQRSGRYRGREKEVAARIVNKQRAAYGETRQEKAKDRSGQSPDRNLPVKDYQHLTIVQIKGRVRDLSSRDRKTILNYEKKHKNRKGVVELLERKAA